MGTGREFSFAGTRAPAATAPDARRAHPGGAPSAMIALALVGLAVAFYDSYAIHTGQALWCPPPIDGCNEVAASPYARILDLPVGNYGVVYYLDMLALATLLACDPGTRSLRIGAVVLAAAGVAFSAYFMALQIGYIGAFCIYCLVSALTTVLLTATAVAHLRATGGAAATAAS